MAEDDEAPVLTEIPAVFAMRMAMQAANEAAETRAKAKEASQKRGRAPDLTPDDEAWQVIAETATDRVAFEREASGESLYVQATFELREAEDISSLIAELDAALPELPGNEVHGDLTILKPEEQARAWYDLAAEAALPEAVRGIAGPVDVKSLLTALLVEIGDVKRTNAMLMEQLARIEEKVDRTHRAVRPPR